MDAIYMDSVQAMTGRGGWPMTVFLTPDGRPFFGGTYYPDRPRGGMASFRQGDGGHRRGLDQPPSRRAGPGRPAGDPDRSDVACRGVA